MNTIPYQRIRSLVALFDQLPAGVFVATLEGRIQYANRYFLEHCAWACGRQGAGSEAEAGVLYLREDFAEGNRRAAAEGTLSKVHYIEAPAGERRAFEVHRFAVCLEGEDETLVGGVALDVTARMQEEQHRRMLAHALEHSPAMVFITDAEGHLQYVNRKFADLTGYTLEETLGRLPRSLDPACLTPEEYHERWGAIRAGREWQGEFLNYKKSGEPYWELVQITPIRDEQGTLTNIVLVKQDITQRKLAELAERQQRERAEALSETAALLTRTLDLERIFDHILVQAARLVPYDAGRLGVIHDGVQHIVRTQGYGPYRGDRAVKTVALPVEEIPTLQAMVSTHQPVIIPDIYADPNWIPLAEPKSLRAYLGVPLVVHDEVLGVLALLSETPGFFTQEHARLLQALADQAAQALQNAQLYQAVRDYAAVLEDRVAERTEALRLSEERARAQYKAVPVPTFVVQRRPDGEFILVDYNDAAFEFTDGSVAKWVGQAASVFHQERPDFLEMARECFEQRTTLQREGYYTVKETGRRHYLQITVSFVPPDLLLIHSVDLTDRKRYEETLQAALEREKYLGELRSRLVTTISHEFRTPLSIILSSADILERYAEKLTDEDRSRRFAHIREAIRRITHLLDDVLELSAIQSAETVITPEPIDLAVLCEQVIAQAGGTRGDEVRVRLEVKTCPGLVLLDHHLVRQILHHLISNAVKFSHAGGEVTVRLSCQEERITIEVQDQGIGIPVADRSQVFDGFFRGSNVGHTTGTGLGLTIARQAVELCGGTIGFQTEEGRGTTFTVRLPYVPAPDVTRGED